MGALTTIVEPWMPIFPARTVRRLRYSDSKTLSSASGVAVGYILRANDVFDPDFTGTGHQPMGFDQLIAFYNHFCVVKSRLVVTFINTTASPPTVCIRQDADNTLITNINQIMEFGGMVTEQLEVKGSYGANKVLEMTCDIAHIQGVNRQAILANNALAGNALASPSEVTFYHIMMWDQTALSGSCTINFVVEYDVVFFEPRDMTQSLERKQPPKHSTPLLKSGVCY